MTGNDKNKKIIKLTIMKKIIGSATLILSCTIMLPNISFSQLFAGGGNQHTLAICNNGTVNAYGQNLWGQLGNGTYNSSGVPVPVTGLTGIIAVDACGFPDVYYGGLHSLALKNDGTVWAWGSNINGQLGNGTNTNSNVPVQVSGLSGITAIAGGHNGSFSLALKNNGTVWAWGDNSTGQLGNGTTTNSNVPVQVNGLTGVVGIAGGGWHALAVKSDGTVWAWGNNIYGQLGNGTTYDSYIPVQVSSLTGISDVAAAVRHSLAL